MLPFKLSQNALAKALNVAPRRINEIVNKKRAITPDTALRPSKFFGNSAKFWLNLQSSYDLEVAKDNLANKIDKEVVSIYSKIQSVDKLDFNQAVGIV